MKRKLGHSSIWKGNSPAINKPVNSIGFWRWYMTYRSDILSLDFVHLTFNVVLRFGSQLGFSLQVKEST
jgi:hypothetical protein